MDEAALLKLAEAEILGEAKRARVRHASSGPSGWKPAPKMNKSFLVNTLLQTLSSNRILSTKLGHTVKSDRKLLQKDKNVTKNNFIYQKPKVKKKSVKKEDKKPVKIESNVKVKKSKNKCQSKTKSKGKSKRKR